MSVLQFDNFRMNGKKSRSPEIAVNDLGVDQFKMIADWHHFAILASTELSNIEATPENLAKVLGLSLSEVHVAVERLIRLEMLEKDSFGRLRKTLSNPRFISQERNRALRSFHRQTLEKAIESLTVLEPDEKVFGTETFCIDDSQFEEFEELCNQFLDGALALAKKAKTKTQVYHLGVQFFRFSKGKKKEVRK
jgi:uncharacterized protein (TIGR02147 family)